MDTKKSCECCVPFNQVPSIADVVHLLHQFIKEDPDIKTWPVCIDKDLKLYPTAVIKWRGSADQIALIHLIQVINPSGRMIGTTNIIPFFYKKNIKPKAWRNGMKKFKVEPAIPMSFCRLQPRHSYCICLNIACPN